MPLGLSRILKGKQGRAGDPATVREYRDRYESADGSPRREVGHAGLSQGSNGGR